MPAPGERETAADSRIGELWQRFALYVSGLDSQVELLEFAGELGSSSTISDLSLVRANRASGIFALNAPDRQRLLAALCQVSGFAVQAMLREGESQVVDVIAARTGHERPRQANASPAQAPEGAGPPAAAEPPPAVAGHRGERRSGARGFAGVVRLLGRTPIESAPPRGEPAAERPTGVEPQYPAVPAREPAAVGPLVGSNARPGGAAPLREHIMLIAHPFRSFARVSEFQDRLRGLEGVVNLKVSRFYRGTLQLRVEYEGIIPLERRLQDLKEFPAVATSKQDDGSIEIALEG